MTIGIVSVVLFAEATACNSLAQMRPGASALVQWALDLSWYLVTGVIPYAAPFIIAAVWLHSELREGLFAPAASC